jgi:AcrR family transcriptional regulator
MMATQQGLVRVKKSFHHGDLRETLIAATHQLLIEQRPDGFTLADACRRAGVTTAAPYKHFRDKQEILEEIILRGFEELTATNAKAFAEGGAGTVEGVTAMGISYLEFAVSQPAIFRVMFGPKSGIRKMKQISEAGNQCLNHVVDSIAACSRERGHWDDAEEIALRLWTFVHGASALELDGDYGRVAPGLDVRALLTRVTPLLLAGSTPNRAKRKRISAS